MDKAMNLDMYGRPFLFKLPNEQQKYKSIFGSVCSVGIVIVISLYAIYKWQIMIAKDETIVQRTLETDYHNDGFKFSSSQGFNIAFGLSSSVEVE